MRQSLIIFNELQLIFLIFVYFFSLKKYFHLDNKNCIINAHIINWLHIHFFTTENLLQVTSARNREFSHLCMIARSKQHRST